MQLIGLGGGYCWLWRWMAVYLDASFNIHETKFFLKGGFATFDFFIVA